MARNGPRHSRQLWPRSDLVVRVGVRVQVGIRARVRATARVRLRAMIGLMLGLGLRSTWWPLGACSPSSRYHRLWCHTVHGNCGTPEAGTCTAHAQQSTPPGHAALRLKYVRSSPAPIVTSEHAIEMAVPAIDGWSDRPPSEMPETTLARSSAAHEASPSVGMSAAWRELAVAFPRPRLAQAASCRASKLLLQPLPLH
eukprot:scaffold14182_cov65-Phaeocystis_antarctica.AAC.3